MEKTTLESLDWTLGKGMLLAATDVHICLWCLGDIVSPANVTAPHRTQLLIRRRFQFSSALKRMSTVSVLPGGKAVAGVKGAPETIRTMLSVIPEHYDDTYKWFTRKGSRVLALGMKEMGTISVDKVSGHTVGSVYLVYLGCYRSTN
jgi:manganese-transporting P-type ATPase